MSPEGTCLSAARAPWAVRDVCTLFGAWPASKLPSHITAQLQQQGPRGRLHPCCLADGPLPCWYA